MIYISKVAHRQNFNVRLIKMSEVTYYKVGDCMENALEVNQLTVMYDGTKAIEDISLSVPHGKLVGIVGPNGAGKSTFIKTVLGLVPKISGSVSIEGKSLKHKQKQIAYVPQRNNIDWDFPILVKDAVLLGTYPKLKLFQFPTKAEKRLVEDCLETVGMLDFKNRQIGELSGGQQQRVFVARALAQEANIFFLDEPFVGIDAKSEQMIINILKNLRDQEKAIFIVHHDLSKVTHYFDEVILMNKKLIASGPTNEVMTQENMAEAFSMDFHLFQQLGGES